MDRLLKRRQRSSAAPGGEPYGRTAQPQPRSLALEAHRAARRRGHDTVHDPRAVRFRVSRAGLPAAGVGFPAHVNNAQPTQEAPSVRVTWEKEAQGAEPLPSEQTAAVMERKAAGNGFPLV